MFFKLLKKLIFWLITVVAVVVIILRAFFPGSWEVLFEKGAAGAGQTIFTSGPLSHFNGGFGAKLLPEQVVAFTNAERIKEGREPLARNNLLDKAAENKMQDMFEGQYFEHVSPSGKGPADVINQTGYQYIVVGENLAQGLFSSDQDLINAWMASPGHRANILHARFSEIGVAVGQGVMDGKKVWLAVQEFGRPLSLCPGVDANLKKDVEARKASIAAAQVLLEIEREKLEANSTRTQQDVDAYNAKVRDQKSQVDELQSKIRVYNQQVSAFNSCINESH